MNLPSLSDYPASTTHPWDLAFITACHDGHLPEIERLCTLLHQNPSVGDPHWNDDEAFRWACVRGQTSVVHYLLTSPLLSNQDPFFLNEGIKIALDYDHMEIVQLLLQQPPDPRFYYTQLDIHAHQDLAFRTACQQGDLRLVQFFTSHPLLPHTGHSWVDVNTPFAREGLSYACRSHYNDIIRWCMLSLPPSRALILTPQDPLLQYPIIQETQRIRQEQILLSNLNPSSPLDSTDSSFSSSSLRL